MPTSFEQGDDHPAVNVSWMDAKAFCRWLSQREHELGILPPGWDYRLPSDAEWSRAVGLGEEPGGSPVEKSAATGGYPWGSQWPPPAGAGNYGRLSQCDSPFAYTSPVGYFHPNRYGLYDMGGNVWEWCEDLLDPSSEERRVLRGGSWRTGRVTLLLSSYRDRGRPVARHVFNGFRCALSSF